MSITKITMLAADHTTPLSDGAMYPDREQLIFHFEFDDMLPEHTIIYEMYYRASGTQSDWKISAVQGFLTLNQGRDLVFPMGFDAHVSGAELAFSFGVKNPLSPPFQDDVPTVKYLQLVSNQKFLTGDEASTPKMIKSVLWSATEYIQYGIENPKRTNICQDEDGFLHIHTRGMYGQRVRVEIYERDNYGKDAVLKVFDDIQIYHNIRYLPVSMNEIYSSAERVRMKNAEGKNFDIVARVIAKDTSIRDYKESNMLYLSIDEVADKKAQRSTVNGVSKVVIGSATNEEKEKPKEVEKNITIHIGVCFDGTNNSRDNIDEYNRATEAQRKKDSRFNDGESSYRQGYSNIVHLYNGYYKGVDAKDENTYYEKVYVEGVGTAPREEGQEHGGKDSDIWGKGFAVVYDGINQKIERACAKVTTVVQRAMDIVKKKTEEDEQEEGKPPPKVTVKIEKINIDVFGFSRGAATARSFISRRVVTLDGKEFCLWQHLKDNQIAVTSAQLVPQFMGLFDTVSSHGVSLSGEYENDKKDLRLQVGTPKQVVQLVAGDEYRLYFPLTRILSAGNPIELILPGAHSDIGGGYAENDVERLILKPEMRYTGVQGVVVLSAVYAGNKSLQELQDEGWFTEEQVKQGSRTISTQYQLIPLYKMKKLAEVFRNDMFKNDGFDKTELKITDSDLIGFNNEVQAMNSNTLYDFTNDHRIIPLYDRHIRFKKWRHKYLHLSATLKIGKDARDKNQRYVINDNENDKSKKI